MVRHWFDLSIPKRTVHALAPREMRTLLAKTIFFPIAVLLVASGSFSWQVKALVEENHALMEAQETLSVSTQALKLIIDMETGLRGYLLTNLDWDLEPYTQASEKVPPKFTELRNRLSGDDQQTRRLEALRTHYERWQESARAAIAVKKFESRNQSLTTFRSRKVMMDQIRGLFAEIEAKEVAARDLLVKQVEHATQVAFLGTLIFGLLMGALLAFGGIRLIKGLVRSFNLLISDLAEARDTLEERVRLRTVELTSANRELEAFSYSVSHDLRAPLRGIDGFSKALADDFGATLKPEALQYLKFIRQGVQRMGVLIDDLLNLSRLTRADLHPRPLNLSSMVRDLGAELRANHPDRNVELVVHPSPDVQADPGLMRVALQNLLENAWKFTRKAELPRVEFGAEARPDETLFYVRDNGTGFDMRFSDKLFKVFQRLHAKEDFPGTGIGLATVARVLIRHGGRVWAESQLGSGATFYFTLPSLTSIDSGKENHP